MEPIAIHIKEDRGLARKGEVVHFGIPVQKGQGNSSGSFVLYNPQTGMPVPCQADSIAYWQDGSPRWLRVCVVLDMEAGEQLTLHLRCHDSATSGHAAISPVRIKSTTTAVLVNTDTFEARVELNGLRWSIQQNTTNGSCKDHEIVLTDKDGQECHARLAGGWKVRQQGELSLTLGAEGCWYRADGSLLARFECYLYFLANCDTVSVETRVHNPKRAQHSGGLWDLGDPGSVHFRSLEIEVMNPGSDRVWLRPEIHDAPVEDSADGLTLYQDSSGGENWGSPNHNDALGESSVRFCGYQVCSGDQCVSRGKRATPVAGLTGRDGSVQASIGRFWQNFPSSLSVDANRLTLGLFPADTAGPYELQGGERKTQTAYLHYGDDPDALLWTQAPLVPVIDSSHFERTGAFPWFRSGMAPGALDALIRQGLDGPWNFFAKREVIDEYGWRNFGDVFADHETHYQEPGEAPLISHYNNQYDAIYGFARQFALTGDRRWFELMDDLARHVTDIDIYHTQEDRAEYNGGLFWHTDHYLDAHTATHRTFTRHNDTSSTPGQTGGGPASEHCYTTGLLYHYYLTGAESSRDAVLQLARWMTSAHEGQGGLLEQLLALKKNELPKLRALTRGEKPLAHRYPFTRGTGNYLNALLDAWLLQPEHGWLQQAEAVIRNTIHPNDNIDERDLLNVETGWSYLILLASIVRYIALKDELGEQDEPYRYALRSFLRYAEWMKAHERPFLADPDQLEFANDTWVAQDVRKAMLMFQAANLSGSDAEAYYAKGTEWLDYVCNRLEASDEARYARILIILMQNYGPQHLEPATGSTTADNLNGEMDSLTLSEPRLTWATLMARMTQRLLRGIRTFRPGREKAWLDARLDRT
ncbi:hypothetical protein SAMN05216203_1601 [Marinobacter daqiaonensis]|uniref:PcRGLX/YetA-like N-terminal RIFT barrel domain-containing protein n=2 Tax=Marinobacter daqiaonensis TaxID=650891 RepID=A0A1I6HW19_9GAMM|nr:hypothetical protein SAMN05216203_1601 [Marinobacter daqiaonensis]